MQTTNGAYNTLRSYYIVFYTASPREFEIIWWKQIIIKEITHTSQEVWVEVRVISCLVWLHLGFDLLVFVLLGDHLFKNFAVITLLI